MNKVIFKTLNSLASYWDKSNRFDFLRSEHRKSPYSVQDLTSRLFIPGPSIVFVFNYVTRELEYVSDSAREILLEEPDSLTFEKLFGMVPLSDMAKTLKDQKASFKFFKKVYTNDNIFDYKLVFTSKCRRRDGVIKKMLHQGMNLEVNDRGQITKVFVVHTDMSHFNFFDEGSMSLIGMNGNPSYYSINRWKNFDVLEQIEYELTARQLSIIKMIADSKTNKQIAEELGLSVDTIKTHRKKMLKNTGKATMYELVSDCYMKGILS